MLRICDFRSCFRAFRAFGSHFQHAVAGVVCHQRSARSRAGQFRSARQRLSACACAVRRSCRLRSAMRTRPPLPRMEFQLSDRQCRWRRLLAEERRSPAGSQVIAVFQVCAAPVSSSSATAQSKARPTGSAVIIGALMSGTTRPAKLRARPTTNAAHGHLPGQVMSENLHGVS